MQPVVGASIEELLAQVRVGSDAAAEHQALGSDLCRRPSRLGDEHVDHGGLERRDDIARLGVRVLADVVASQPSSVR